MPKIKVLEFEITENMGGVESLLCSIDRKIDKNKFQIDFIANHPAKYQKELKELGSNIYLLPSVFNYEKYKKRLNNILDRHYDIVHFNKNSLANSLPLYIVNRHESHPKIILHSHNTAPTRSTPGLKSLHKLNKLLVNNIPNYKIACSKEAEKWMFNKNNKVEIINNGIDIAKFQFSENKRQLIRQKYDIGDDTVLIGNVGRFNQQKNHVGIVNIFEKINRLNANTKLMLIGEGKEKEKIIHLVNEKKLDKKVIFVGNTSHVDEYLSAMDIFLMPSLYEGLPIAAVEAQTSGLLTFVSDNISDEVYLNQAIYPISLNWGYDRIAAFINDKAITLNDIDRKAQATIVKQKGFDIKDATNRIEEIYTKLALNS